LDGDQILHEGDPFHSGKRWEHHGRSAYGLMWAWDDPSEDRPGKGWICIKGSYLSYMEPEAVQCLLRILILDYGVKTTRLDFALDDYSKAVTPYQVLQAGFARQFARFKRPPRFSGDAADGSLTVTFGSRFSDKLLRVYDKAKESKGEIDAIRWEIEFKDEVAHAHACQFIDCPWAELPYEFVAQAVVGSIEFCEVGEGRRSFSSYCLLPWWEAFKAAIGSIRLPVPRKPQTLERRRQWMRSAWSKTLAGMSLVFGSEVVVRGIVAGLMQTGRDRLTSTDLNLFKVWQYEHELQCQT
ncbi:replication initiation factor domain-containing protein, partial [Candidatus Synechococcus calcipolaris G9]